MAKTKAEFEGASAEDLAIANDPIVDCVVTKKGDGKISTGVHQAIGGDVLYEQDDTFSVAKSIADGLEDLGYVMIQKAKPAKVQGA